MHTRKYNLIIMPSFLYMYLTRAVYMCQSFTRVNCHYYQNICIVCLFERPFKIKNTEEWRFSFWNICFRFRDIDIFSIMQIRSVMTSYCLQLKSGKYWINDISGNIEAVFLKLGIINVHHKRNKMTPLVPLPWQHFCLL